MKFRDPSAWYNLVVAYDSTDGTAANRLKVYVNGSQITGTFSSDLGQNVSAHWGDDASAGRIGAYNNNTGDSYMMNGYLADVCGTVGYALTPSSFGETNDNGVWIPSKPSVTYSANGFFLEFKQTGTSANASGIGADTSGNTNHFSVDSDDTSEYFQTTDTPTNNFATFNPLIVGTNYNPTLSKGNTKVSVNSTGKHGGYSSIGVANGKWNAEFKCITTVASVIGIVNDPSEQCRTFGKPGEGAKDVGYLSADGNKLIGDSGSTHGATYTNNDIILSLIHI